MTQPISGLSGLPGLSPFVSADRSVPQASSSGNFQNLLTQAINDVSALQQQAEVSALQSMSGGDVTEVEALAALKKADLALRLMLQIRNKLVQAYQEIQQMRM